MKNNYNFSADVVRVLAIVGVVVIHSANAVFARPDFFGGLSWWFAIVLNSISRASIPLFIMVSGYFILARNESFRKALERTSNRLLFPLLFWLVFYVIWNGGSPTLEYLNFSLIYRLFTVNVIFLYFFIILIGLYLASPLIKRYLLIPLKTSLKITALILLVLSSLFYFFQYYFSLCTPANSLIYWVPFTGLFVAGYVYGREKNFNLPFLSLLYLLSLGITVAGAYLYYSLSNQGSDVLNARGCLTFYSDSYLSINVVIMSVTAFIILMHTKFEWLFKLGKIKNLIYSIARASLGIFVLHIFFLDILDRQLNLFIWITPAWLYLVVKVLVIFAVSYLTTLILIKVPFLKRTFGEK